MLKFHNLLHFMFITIAWAGSTYTGDVDCPSPFVSIGKSCYLIEGQQKVSWYRAAHICRTQNAQLASFDMASDLVALSDYLVFYEFDKVERPWFWLSGNDLDKEGSFFWLRTGQALTYTKWSPSQPDNAGGHENCVHLWLHNHSFYMNDWVCNGEAHYICQYEMNNSPILIK